MRPSSQPRRSSYRPPYSLSTLSRLRRLPLDRYAGAVSTEWLWNRMIFPESDKAGDQQPKAKLRRKSVVGSSLYLLGSARVQDDLLHSPRCDFRYQDFVRIAAVDFMDCAELPELLASGSE